MREVFFISGVVPSVNNLYCTGRRLSGRKILTKQQKAFRDHVAAIVNGRKIGETTVDVKIYYCPPDRRRRDVDNIIKSIFDALTAAGYWVDDSQVARVSSCFLIPQKRNDAGAFVVIEETKTKYFDKELKETVLNARFNKTSGGGRIK